MNKLVSIILGSLISTFSYATTVTINSDSTQPDSARASLSTVPQEVLGILLDNGIKFKTSKTNSKLFVAHISSLNCFYRHNGAVDSVYPTSGVPSFQCRYNSDTELGSAKGNVLKDGRKLEDLINHVFDTLQTENSLSDCAMGKCAFLVKSISCQVDTAVEEFQKGRFSCSISSY